MQPEEDRPDLRDQAPGPASPGSHRNHAMAALLARTPSQPLPTAVTRILAGGLRRTGDGCLLLAALAHRADPLAIERMGDRTGLECFVNQIELPAAAITAFVTTLAARLRAALPTGGWAIVVRVVEGTALGTFHQERVGEPFSDRAPDAWAEPLWIERP